MSPTFPGKHLAIGSLLPVACYSILADATVAMIVVTWRLGAAATIWLPIGAVYLGLMTLAGIWLALGKAHWLAVWGLPLAACLFWAVVLHAFLCAPYSSDSFDPSFAEIVPIPASFLSVGALLALPWRLRGYRWMDTYGSNSGSKGDTMVQQYSLRALLWWMVIAFLSRFAEVRRGELMGLAIYASVTALQGTLSVAAFAHAQSRLSRTAAVLGTGLLTGLAFAGVLALQAPWKTAWAALGFHLSFSLVLLASLAVCDAAGWRIVRLRRPTVAEAIEAE